MIVIKPLNELFTEVGGYRNYHLIKKSARYDDNVANELGMMTKKTSVQMKDRTFNGKHPLSIIAFLHDFKAVCVVSNIQRGAEMWIFKRYLNGPIDSVIKEHIELPTKTA